MIDKKINYLYEKYSKLDKDGWKELKIVKKYIKGDLYSYFSYEDNVGLFEDMNGKQLIKWYEKMQFSNIVDSKIIGIYEKCTYSNPTENKDYLNYRKNVMSDFINVMQNKLDISL